MRLMIFKKANPGFFLLLVAFSLVSATDTQAQGIGSYDKERGQMMLDQAKNDIKSKYYDPHYHGVNLETVFKEASEKIKNAQSNGQIMGIIATAVLTLDDSHTAFIPPMRHAITDYGWEMMVIGNDVYVSKVKEKSDAEAKGLKVGDQVHLVDGYQPVRENFWKMVYLYYLLRPQPGMHLAVSSPGAEPRQFDIVAKITERKRIDLANYVDFMDLVRESEGEERKRKKSHRLQELDDILIWKMPSFNLLAEEVDGLMDKARTHKTLILDLRGNGGGFEETLLRMIGNVFDHDMNVGEIQRRKETKPLLAKTRGDKIFNGKLIVLVDSISASASEVFSRVVQLEKRGTVIGDHTAGAVMRSIQYPHEIGISGLTLFAMSVTDADVRMSDGKTLEKVGVTPDEIKLPSGADLVSKSDPVLAYAVTLAGGTITPEKAGVLFPEVKNKP